MGADAPDQSPDMARDLFPGRRLRGAEHESDGPSGLGLVDMDRRVAALAMEAVPEGELLFAMGGVERVVDVQRDRRRRRAIAVAVDVDQLVGQADRCAQVGRIFPPGHGGLTGETDLRIRRLAERHLERGVVAQAVQIVGIFIPCRDREIPRQQNVRQYVAHPRRIALIGDMRGEASRDPELLLGLGEQQNAAV